MSKREATTKDYIDAQDGGLLRLGVCVVVGFAAMIMVVDKKNSKAIALALDVVDKVTKTILDNVDEKAKHHNGLFDIIMNRLGRMVSYSHILSALIGAAAVASIMQYFR